MGPQMGQHFNHKSSLLQVAIKLQVVNNRLKERELLNKSAVTLRLVVRESDVPFRVVPELCSPAPVDWPVSLLPRPTGPFHPATASLPP